MTVTHVTHAAATGKTPKIRFLLCAPLFPAVVGIALPPLVGLEAVELVRINGLFLGRDGLLKKYKSHFGLAVPVRNQSRISIYIKL
jgi:hypothetical protein